MARQATLPAAGVAASARIGASARRRRGDSTSTTSRRSPARSMRRSGCPRRRTRGSGRSTSRPCAQRRAWSRCSRPPTFPGENDCGPIIHDDPILADGLVQYVGQPMFVVVAATVRCRAARRAPRQGRLRRAAAGAHAAGSEAPAVVRAAADASPARRRRHGDGAPHRAGWAASSTSAARSSSISRGRSPTRVPKEDGCIHLYCSTQHPTEMQHVVAHALNLVANQVTVEMRRMGGGFGGKESQSALYACVAARGGAAAARAGQDPARPRRRLHGRPASATASTTSTRSGTATMG